MAKAFRIKQHLWSLGGEFTVTDQSGLPCYHVEGSLFKIPKTFVVTDMEGIEVSRIQKEFFTFLPRFHVHMTNGMNFTIQKEFTFFRDRYSVTNLAVDVQGDFWDMNFELYKNGQMVAAISQEWLRLTSTYNIMVYDDAYADLAISMVIAIDYVKQSEKNNNHNN